jgi:hypothetical protein
MTRGGASAPSGRAAVPVEAGRGPRKGNERELANAPVWRGKATH